MATFSAIYKLGLNPVAAFYTYSRVGPGRKTNFPKTLFICKRTSTMYNLQDYLVWYF